MKRLPRNGEPVLSHKTVDTGDIQELAICAENFDPHVITQMREMLEKPMAGYRIADVSVTGPDVQFSVVRDSDGAYLSENWARWHGPDIVLTTTLATQDMPPDEAFMLADLEQCAALMLLENKNGKR